MMSAAHSRRPTVMLEPAGMAVSVGSRIAYLFCGPDERTRFAWFIAQGLFAGEKCVIITDALGRHLFADRLASLGVRVDEHERDGSLLFVTEELTVESLDYLALQLFQDIRSHYGRGRCINDSSARHAQGWTARDFFRLEVKGHLVSQYQPFTVICQYDTDFVARRELDQILAAHQVTVIGSAIERNPDRRPLGQIVFDGMDEQLRALSRLQDLSLRLTTALDLKATLDAIIEAAMTICNGDKAAISLLTESGELRLMAHRGLSPAYLERRRLTHEDPSLGGLLDYKRPSVVEDTEQLAGLSPNYPAWHQEGVRSIVTLPLVRDGKVFGLLGAGSTQPRRYTHTDIDAMAILAAQAAAAITTSQLFDQLREANRAKDEFLATLSHELRTPLTPILGWTHILKPEAAPDTLLEQGLDAIERNAQQQAGLINDLLDLTRIISGKIEISRQPINLVELVAACVEEIRPQAMGREINLHVDLPQGRLVREVDPSRMRQVLGNLLTNAVKFTPDGGDVFVTLSVEAGVDEKTSGHDDGSGVRIEVADTGIGIDPEFLPRVFERFTQAQSGLTRRYGGLGLGLAISKALVEMHGGEIFAESEGQGRGSRFIVKLPGRAMPSAASVGVTPPQTGEAEPLNLRVLVVEDSGDTLDMLKLWLHTFHCEVLTASDAREGIRLALERRPNLLISDIGLPEMDGFELIRELRRHREMADLPAIALTGYAREEDRVEALAAGYTAYLAKPAEMPRLLQLIRSITKK